MSHSNLQIEKLLNRLTEMCCASLQGEQQSDIGQADEVLKSLVMSGYARQEGPSLQAELEKRVKNQCLDASMHRGGSLSGLTGQLQKKFDDLVRWEAQRPKADSEDSKAANISSATDA